MKNCKACKKEIDPKATKCPYCQTDQRSWRSRHKILTVLIGIIGLIILISVVAARNGGGTKTTDSSTSQKVESSWNTEDSDAMKNGNIEIATKQLSNLSEENIKEKVETLDIASIQKAPWKYYGRIVKIKGEVNQAYDYPPGSETAKALGGGEAGELALVTEDSIIVYYLHTASTGKIKSGDTVTVYGYPVGLAEMTYLGTPQTKLVIVGKTIETVTQ